MKHWLLLIAIALACALPLRAQGDDDADDAKSDAPATEAQTKYKALVTQYDVAVAKYSKDYQQAKTDAEREKLNYPQPDSYAGWFLSLAKEYPKDRAAVDALVWIGQHCRDGKELDESLDLLLKNYLASGRLSRVAQSLIYTQTDRTETWLKTVMEKSPHYKVQGVAAYSLARFYNQRAELASGSAGDWRKKAEQLFEQIIKKYGDVKSYRGTLADSAKGDLFEIRNLAIGQVAPEIEGEDVEGKKLKLSEHRGKVVVIDFWGDW